MEGDVSPIDDPAGGRNNRGDLEGGSTLEARAQTGGSWDRASLLAMALVALLAAGMAYPSQAWPGAGLLVGTGLLGVMALAVLDRRREALAVGPASLALGLLVAWALFRAIQGWRAPYLPPAAGLAATAQLGAAAFLAALLLTSTGGERVTRVLAVGIGGLAALMALHALWQVHGPAGMSGTFRSMEASILASMNPDDPMREGLLHAVREGRASSRLGAPNIFGSVCVMGILLGAALALMGRGIARPVAGTAAVLCLVALVMSGSRGGILALLVGGGMLSILLAAWRWAGSRAFRMVAGGLCVAALLAVVGLLVLFNRDGGGGRWQGSSGLGQRVLYWQAAMEGWRQAPLLGNGTGSYEVIYLRARQPGSNETRHAHSWLFDSLAEGGIVGTGLLLGFLALAVGWVGWRVVERGRRREGTAADHAMVAGLLAAGAAVWIHGLAEYTISFRETALAGLIALGAAAGRTLPTSPRRANTPPLLLVAGMVLVMAALWMRTEWRFQLAKELREGAVALWQTGTERDEAMKLANEAVRLAPEEGANWETRGIFRMSLNDGRALGDLQEASARHPQSGRLRERLSIYFEARGDMDRARALQKEAIDNHPLDAMHRLRLALLLDRMGRNDEARHVYQETEGLLIPTLQGRRYRESVGRELGIVEAEGDQSG